MKFDNIASSKVVGSSKGWNVVVKKNDGREREIVCASLLDAMNIWKTIKGLKKGL